MKDSDLFYLLLMKYWNHYHIYRKREPGLSFFLPSFLGCDNFSKSSLLSLYHSYENQVLIFYWGFGGEATKLSYRWLSKLKGFGRLAI